MGMERAVEKLAPLAIAFVTVGIVIGFGAVVLQEMTELDAVEGDEEETVAYEILNAALGALETFGSFLGVIAIVALAAIIFVLLRVFGGSGNRQAMA